MLRRDEISGRWHIKDFSFTTSPFDGGCVFVPTRKFALFVVSAIFRDWLERVEKWERSGNAREQETGKASHVALSHCVLAEQATTRNFSVPANTFFFFYTKKNIIGGSFILVLKVALMIRSFRIIIYFYSYYSNFEKRKEIYKIDSKLLINDIYSTKKNVTISIPLSLLTRISFDILLQATKSYDKISAKKNSLSPLSSLIHRGHWLEIQQCSS